MLQYDLMTIERVEYYMRLHKAWMNVFLRHLCLAYTVDDSHEAVNTDMAKFKYPSSAFLGVAMSIANAENEEHLIASLIKTAWIDAREEYFDKSDLFEPSKSMLYADLSEEGVYEREIMKIVEIHRDEKMVQLILDRFKRSVFTAEQRVNVQGLIDIDFSTYKLDRLHDIMQVASLTTQGEDNKIDSI